MEAASVLKAAHRYSSCVGYLVLAMVQIASVCLEECSMEIRGPPGPGLSGIIDLIGSEFQVSGSGLQGLGAGSRWPTLMSVNVVMV